MTFAFCLMLILFSGILSNIGFFDLIASYVDTTYSLAYLVTAWAGWSLFVTSFSLRESDDDEESSDIVSDIVDEGLSLSTIIEGGKTIFRGYAVLTYMPLLISVGALMGMWVSTYVSVAAGVIVAGLFPTFDFVIAKKLHWALSPSSLLLFLTYPVLIVLSAVTVTVSITLGLILGVSTVITLLCKRLWERLTWPLWDVLEKADIPNAATKPYQRIGLR